MFVCLIVLNMSLHHITGQEGSTCYMLKRKYMNTRVSRRVALSEEESMVRGSKANMVRLQGLAGHY